MRPTVDRLRELVCYDESSPSGLSWKISRGRQSSGSAAGQPRNQDGRIYWYVRVDGSLILVHRVIWALATGNWPKDQIDHKDGYQNLVSNLREATQTQNNANQRLRKNTSGLKGVHWNTKRKRWIAKINKNGKTVQLGQFSSKDDAHEAYWIAAQEHFGQFARRA